MRSVPDSAMSEALHDDIEACGYFPNLVEDTVRIAVADEPVLHYVVHHEPTFSHDEIHRHLTILVLTPTRLVVGHTDEAPVESPQPELQAASSTESIGLDRINTVTLTRVIAQPATYDPRRPVVPETWLTVGWGAVRRVDLEPASCGDPQCEADHGYAGTLASDDLTVRMSSAADGERSVAQLLAFGTALQRAAGASGGQPAGGPLNGGPLDGGPRNGGQHG